MKSILPKVAFQADFEVSLPSEFTYSEVQTRLITRSYANPSASISHLGMHKNQCSGGVKGALSNEIKES